MILSASGGIVYHARAAFTRIESLWSVTGEDRWAPTRRCVSNHLSLWLNEIQPEQLILFGPSAGYLLEPDFFSQLNHVASRKPFSIVAVDPDPIAQFLFRRRFSMSNVTWHERSDLLPFASEDSGAFGDFLRQSFAKTNETAILFLGVLGQIALHDRDRLRPDAQARRLMQFELDDLNWASLHDLESTVLTRGLRELPSSLTPEALTEPSVAGFLTSQTARIDFLSGRLGTAKTEGAAWIDHETQWLGGVDTFIPWLLTPRRFHSLGLVRRRLLSPAKR